MVARLSHADHVILEGHYIPDVMGGRTNWSSDGGLGCDGMVPTGVKNVFSNPTKVQKVGIDKEKTSRVIVREKLSKRAVVKEDGLGRVYLQERRATTMFKSGTQTVSNGRVSRRVKNRGV